MLTSILILTLNNLAFTQRCLDSILRFTDLPYEIVFVDNGSTDGTTAWLREIAEGSGGQLRALFNADNQGFAAGCNRAAAAARGQCLVLLNNDALVSPRWLSQLHAALYAEPSVAAAGPVSNCVLPLQQRALAAQPGSPEAFYAFADGYNRPNPGKWADVLAISGFCMLVKREAWETLGGLDTRFAIGGYEDIDFGYRVLRAGWRLRIAGDTYVYHEGNKSFEANRLDSSTIADRNRKTFIRRWGFNPERLILRVGALPPDSAPQEDGALPGGWYAMDRSAGVYRIEQGRKRPVVSIEAYAFFRLSADRLARNADLVLQRLPLGAPLDPKLPFPLGYPDQFLASDEIGNLHLVNGGIWYPVHDPRSLAVWGWRAGDAVPIAYETLLALPCGWPVSGDLWESFELPDYRLFVGPGRAYYYSEGGRLRRLAGEEVLSAYGWSPRHAAPISEAQLKRLPPGPALT
ncbi:glycosyltransferase family 2 protein [Cohnella sp. REN36]|uniref:glycosyltransferase family 2 protein n=1 Tax=Cohnella sp. REN36 TaxID=2887347 RepID=UPI001D1451F6|nr:glycosyltransferase family 2 protein [Cohnella sp. REN36]MCC3377295.1 glycosyltransferase family 2 protein [Cohnella sp. REN36]